MKVFFWTIQIVGTAFCHAIRKLQKSGTTRKIPSAQRCARRIVGKRYGGSVLAAGTNGTPEFIAVRQEVLARRAHINGFGQGITISKLCSRKLLNIGIVKKTIFRQIKFFPILRKSTGGLAKRDILILIHQIRKLA